MTATQTQPKTLTENNLAETTHRYLRRERYRAAIAEVDNILGDLYFELQEVIGEVAVEGSFKEWADQQGAVLMLDELDMDEADDPIVKALVELQEHVDEVLQHLPRRLPPKQTQ